jgi:hypothetical protein
VLVVILTWLNLAAKRRVNTSGEVDLDSEDGVAPAAEVDTE